MAKPPQIPVQFTPDQLFRLRNSSAETGRSIGALVREAVDRMLAPTAGVPAEALWSILRDSQHWQTFKQIALTHEVANAPPPAPVDLQPTWRHRKPPDTQSRTKPPAEPIEDPFA